LLTGEFGNTVVLLALGNAPPLALDLYADRFTTS
jgi:hypothetical protein